MKKLLIVSLLAVMSLVAVQSVFAYDFDVHRTYPHYEVSRHTTGQFGVGHDMQTSWSHNGHHSATVTRDVDWASSNGCVTRTAHTNFDFENYGDRERNRVTTYGCC